MILFNKDFEYFFDKHTKAYVKKDFQECLFTAIKCFKLKKTEEQKIISLKMIRFSAEKLIESLISQPLNYEDKYNDENDEKCSFCKKKITDRKLICGVGVNVCHECIKEMYSIIKRSID